MTARARRALADRVGILAEYVDQSGSERRITSDDTRVALLAAMGFDASSEEAARRSLDALDAHEAERILPPVRVMEHRSAVGDLGLDEVEITLASGDEVSITDALPLGYHTVRARAQRDGVMCEEEQRLIVVPSSCFVPARREYGIIANLYTVRSARNWGVGDLTDLSDLAAWAGEIGAAFVGVNPLHALRNRGHDISPYSPITRLYRNPLYLDVEVVPELSESAEARAILEWNTTRTELARLRESDRVEYERVMAVKEPVLRALYRAFATHHRDRGDERGRAYDRYLAEQGSPLADFALYCALDEYFTLDGTHPSPWQRWPIGYQRPESPESAAFRESHREEVDYFRWLQFELDRQLATAAQRASDAHMAVGIYQDLAIGTAADASDTWAFPHLFLRGVSLGAPPDDYAATGQNWGLPPIDPRRLREDRYEYWIRLLRASLEHAGALRIDHVLGLFRQFWIPAGMSGAQGAYVRFPTEEMLGILALESVRHRAIIVGEDLGTVPPEVPSTLKRWGLLASRVLPFEREANGAFRPASSYEPRALATANTHDMVPLAGFWTGRDIELRHALGLLDGDAQLQAAWKARSRDRQALLERLAADGVLDTPREPADRAELLRAVHCFLGRTSCALVGISLDDLVGETEPVNVPGVTQDQFPCWTRRLRTPIERLRDNRGVATALDCVRPRQA